jgi:nicotinate-nucleotide--dimethylbenzimidazole phosphoribosyltransferase
MTTYTLKEQVQHKIDFKTKPTGALGKLEQIALQIALVQDTQSPKLTDPHILVFAADHGIANEGVSAYPQEVTWQMVHNFLSEGAAINVFANQHNIMVLVVDAGVNKHFDKIPLLINAKVAMGTKSFLTEAAMTIDELNLCNGYALHLITELTKNTKCNIIGFGEMGIGNTSAASMIMHCLTNIPLNDCVGKGTGVNDAQFIQKQNILNQALAHHAAIDKKDPYAVLRTFGGFEIAMITEAMLAAYDNKLTFMVDGFIATAAYLVAVKVNPNIEANAIFCHQSNEKGHQLLLNYLNASPLLNLGMRLGEGTGCAVAYPIIQSAVNFLNNMASFETAGVSNK